MREDDICIYKTKTFVQSFDKNILSDLLLVNAVEEIKRGLVDANLGGSLYKKRIAIDNKGKSGSVRTLIAIYHNKKFFFLYGFKKNERDNISEKELRALKKLAKVYLRSTDEEINKYIQKGLLVEVKK